MNVPTLPSAYEFGDFRVDVLHRLLVPKEGGRPLPLHSRAFDTLLFFLQHPAELIDRSTLMAAVWPNVVVEENNLSQHISALRRALGEQAEEHRYIVTIPGRGYRFVATVRSVGVTAIAPRAEIVESQQNTSAATPTMPTGASVASRPKSRRNWFVLAAGLAIVAGALVILAVAYVANGRQEAQTARATALSPVGSQPGTVTQSVAPSDKSVAVIPLKNESGDPKQEYFSDGLSEGLINSLSHIHELKVIGRTSAFHFKNSAETSASIGRQLAVANLIEGSVQREGSTIRVSVELINAADGRTLWSERYDRAYRNLFALQDEIAQSLSQVLKAQLLTSAESQGSTDRPPSGNLDAYALLLKGRYYNALGIGLNLKSAADSLRRAVQLDPNYAAAWYELAVSYNTLSSYANIDPNRNRALAQEAMAHAASLAPNDALIRYGSAVFKIQYGHDPKGAAADIAAAEQSDPSVPMPEELGIVTGCLSGSCYQRYMRNISAVIDRDPLDAFSLDNRGLPRYFAGELAAAERDWRRILEINPDYDYARYYIAQFLIAENKPTEALAIASDERLAVDRKAARAFAFVALGRRAEAEAELRDMIAHDANDGPREIAEVCATLGEKQKALEWLQRDYDGLHPGVFFLRWNPLLRNLRDEPRFRALMDKIWPGS